MSFQELLQFSRLTCKPKHTRRRLIPLHIPSALLATSTYPPPTHMAVQFPSACSSANILGRVSWSPCKVW